MIWALVGIGLVAGVALFLSIMNTEPWARLEALELRASKLERDYQYLASRVAPYEHVTELRKDLALVAQVTRDCARRLDAAEIDHVVEFVVKEDK